MADIDAIAVPFDGYGRPGHQARAAEALRSAGLLRSPGRHRIVADTELDLPTPEPGRGADTSLINEPAVVAMTDALHERVGAALAAGRFPFVYGGDCTTLLGTVTALRDRKPGTGLAFIDGHEDTMPLDVSEDGEAANAEIGLLLGLTGRLLDGPLADRLEPPALQRDRLAVIGPRDEGWRRQFNVGTLADAGVWFASPADVAADPAGVGRRAVEVLGAQWWLHIDLDVLDPDEFPAQGLPDVPDEPGGLTWTELTDLAATMVGVGGCVGFSLAIYDPDQDPDTTCAADIVRFVGTVMARL